MLDGVEDEDGVDGSLLSGELFLNLFARLAALHGTPDLLTSGLECTTLGAELQLPEGVLEDLTGFLIFRCTFFLSDSLTLSHLNSDSCVPQLMRH